MFVVSVLFVVVEEPEELVDLLVLVGLACSLFLVFILSMYFVMQSTVAVGAIIAIAVDYQLCISFLPVGNEILSISIQVFIGFIEETITAKRMCFKLKKVIGNLIIFIQHAFPEFLKFVAFS